MKITLLNPFEKYREAHLFITGVAATLIGSALAWVLHARFDGAIDMHLTTAVEKWEPLADNVVNIVCLSLTLFVAGLLINRKTRPIDLVNTVMVARIPMYLLPLLNLTGFEEMVNSKLDVKNPNLSHFTPMDLLLILVISILLLSMIAYFFYLLYKGFRVATNAKTLPHNLLFVAAIVVAEIVSKLIISQL